MSTVEKVELENGASLGEQLVAAGYKLNKDEARTVFFGTVESILCHCAICEKNNHDDEFEVLRRDGGTVSIGCVDFNPEQVAQVKKWLGE